MLKATLSRLFHSVRTWQTTLFAGLQVFGLILYASSTQFSAYNSPRISQITWLIVCNFLIFGTLYQLIIPVLAQSRLSQLWLLTTSVSWLVGLLIMPLSVTLLTGLTLLDLALLFWLKSRFFNEWGLLTTAVLLGLNATNFFLIDHQYVSVIFLVSLALPICLYFIFLAPFFTATYLIQLEIGGTIGCLITLISTHRSLIATSVTLLIIGGWLFIMLKQARRPSQLALLSTVLTVIVLIISR